MSRRYATVAVIVGVVLILAGCARTTRNGAMTPDIGPEAPGQPEPPYLPAAEAFVTALEQGQTDQAYQMMTEAARKTIPAQQFNTDMGDIGAAGHRVAAQAATEDAAFVLLRFENSGPISPTSQHLSGIELLLRKVGESWQVSFFMPTSDTGEGMNDLALTKTGPRDYTVSWAGPDGSPRSLTIREL